MTHSSGVNGESPLRFPTDYPIKVVGRSEKRFRQRIDAVVLQHCPNLAESREHVTMLVGALVATDGVLMVI